MVLLNVFDAKHSKWSVKICLLRMTWLKLIQSNVEDINSTQIGTRDEFFFWTRFKTNELYKKKIELKNFELLRPGVCMGCQWSSISSVLTFNYRCGAVCFCFIRVSIFEKHINHLAIFAHSRCKNSSVERAERGNVRLKCVVSCF